MRPWLLGIAAGMAGLLPLAAPAAADITLIGHYKLVDGDTLTRASYFAAKRMRTTLPNGDEVIYDHTAGRIALVDHARRLYWEGPRSQADSIASRLRSERAKAIAKDMTPERMARLTEIYSALSESVQVAATGQERKIAGYKCSEWVLTAGPYLKHQRWVARALDVSDFTPEVEKVVLASILDPIGRGLMTLVLQARAVDGLTLAGRMDVKTLSHEGEMSWETLRILSDKIPPEAWKIPEGYQRWQPPAAGAGK